MPFLLFALGLGLTMAFATMPIYPAQAAGATYYVDDDYGNAYPGSGTIADPFHTVQMGIDVASSGDMVQVGAGTYSENITMKSGITIQGAGAGENPALHSIIDGGGTGPVVIAFRVDSTAKLDGFMITNGDSIHGGGMANADSSPTVVNCLFSGNSSAGPGGGMYNSNSSPTVTNCIFIGNSAARKGGGMYNVFSSPKVINCIFSGNSAISTGGMNAQGGGIYNDNSSPKVTNSILWGDTPEEIYSEISSAPVVTYCDVEGGWQGVGNIDADPLFVGGGDYHPTAASPVIDAGTENGAPKRDIEGILRPQGGGYDMGAYEFPGARPWIPLLLLND